MISALSNVHFMKQALLEAKKGAELGEIPVGAVVVANNRIIARAHNQTETLNDVTAHAEMIAITAAAGFLGGKYLKDCTLFVTLEPCAMCAGALNWAQLGKLIYGASDDDRGFMRYGKEFLHPKTKIEYGILEDECSELLSSFFVKLRKQKLNP